MRDRNISPPVDVIESVKTPFKTSSEEKIEELEMEVQMLRMKARKMEKLGDIENRCETNKTQHTLGRNMNKLSKLTGFHFFFRLLVMIPKRMQSFARPCAMCLSL